MINSVFDFCVYLLICASHITGLSYELINILLFIVIHPLITIFIFMKYYKYKKLSIK